MLNEHSEWLKVKVAAVIGVTTPWIADLLVKAGPVLDVFIKLGQFGVAVVTIGYIWAKWRKTQNSK